MWNLLVLDAVDDEMRVGDLVGAGQYPRQVGHHEQRDDYDGDVGHVQLLHSQSWTDLNENLAFNFQHNLSTLTSFSKAQISVN